MLNKLLNWFRRPKWEEFRSYPTAKPGTWDIAARDGDVSTTSPWQLPPPPEPQWRTNFSLTAAQRRQRSLDGWVTRKANKVRLITIDGVIHHEDCVFLDSDVCNCGALDQVKSNGE